MIQERVYSSTARARPGTRKLGRPSYLTPEKERRLRAMLADGVGSSRHEGGEFRQSLAAWRQLCLQIVVFDVFGQLRVAAFHTEILPVSFDSIEAVVGPGNDDGQQLAFGARKS